MLIEQLEENGFEIIGTNTDGLEVIVPNNKRGLYDFICNLWEHDTGFVLEYDIYSKIVIKDCNNYISITEEGKIKEKGSFLTNRSKISLVDELKRAFDMPIIAEALFLYFIEQIPISETIKNNKDIYNFCTSQKAGSEFEIEYHYIKNDDNNIPTKFIEKMQKTNRYYISTKGGALLKKKNNKYTSMAAGLTIEIFNNYIEKDMKDYNIDYNYYISECNKVINVIMNNFQQSLF